jgi:hypothetical protein
MRMSISYDVVKTRYFFQGERRIEIAFNVQAVQLNYSLSNHGNTIQCPISVRGPRRHNYYATAFAEVCKLLLFQKSLLDFQEILEPCAFFELTVTQKCNPDMTLFG